MGSWLGKAFQTLGRLWRESDWYAKIFGIGVDSQTGVPLAMGTEGTFLGLSFSIWSLIVAIIFIVGLLLTVAAPMKGCSSPRPLPSSESKPGDISQRIIVSPQEAEEQRARSENAVAAIDCINDFPSESCKSSVPTKPADDNWESQLQKQRLQALASGNMEKYNALIREHLLIYRQRKTDPCKKGFFPQVCTH